MAVETVFLALAGILFIGFIGEIIFEKTKIPDVIWLILIGIIIGSILNWVTADTFGDIAPYFTTFALVFLLFEAGINMDIKKFLIAAPQGMKLSFLSFIFSFIIIFLLSLIIGKGVGLSLLLGVILGGISSAVIVPMSKNLNVHSVTKLSLVFDSALSDVLCILGTVTVIEILTASAISGMNVISSLLSSFLIAILIGVVTGFVWEKILEKLVKNHEYVLTLSIMLIVFAITQMLNANGAIACLVFGLILGNTSRIKSIFKKEETNGRTTNLIKPSGKEFYGEVAFFIKAAFFVYLGILIDFTEPLSFLWALIILVGLYAVRPFATWLSFGKGTKLSDIRVIETLIPRGLAAAVLVQLPIEAEIAGAESLVNIVLAVILLSIIASTVFAYLVQHHKYPGVFKFLDKKYKQS